MRTDNTKFSMEELRNIDKADDLKISPFRSDGVSYGTPTWIWEVTVNDELFVRAYNGIHSRWYQSAIKQLAGRIHAAGKVWEVNFEPVQDEELSKKIDDAYKKKYSSSPYLESMVSNRAKAASIKINPK